MDTQLLNSIRDELATKYTQKPQLSCSHPLGMFVIILRQQVLFARSFRLTFLLDTNLLFVM